jgi:hypothetical protein
LLSKLVCNEVLMIVQFAAHYTVRVHQHTRLQLNYIDYEPIAISKLTVAVLLLSITNFSCKYLARMTEGRDRREQSCLLTTTMQ